MNYLLLFLATLTSSGKAIICKRIGAGDNGPKRTFLLNSGIFLVASFPVLVIAILDGGFIASSFSVALAALFALTTVITQLTQIGAMKYGTAALTTLIYSAGFIIPTVWSHFAFGEIISPFQLVGIGVMLIALYMIINPGRSGRVSFLWLIFAILSMSGSGANAVLQKIHQRSALSGELYEFLFAALAFASVLCLVLGLTLKGDAGNKKELTTDISIMIIECRKGKKAFSRLIFQPLQKAKKCFLLLYHCNRNRQISFRNLLANQRFAVEILEFRLSIVVITAHNPLIILILAFLIGFYRYITASLKIKVLFRRRPL